MTTPSQALGEEPLPGAPSSRGGRKKKTSKVGTGELAGDVAEQVTLLAGDYNKRVRRGQGDPSQRKKSQVLSVDLADGRGTHPSVPTTSSKLEQGGIALVDAADTG